MTTGKLIVLEGADGVGTTTHTRHLASTLIAAGHAVHSTREPSDGPIGTIVRAVLRGEMMLPTAEASGPSWATMALLFAADRLHHLDCDIVPALRRGEVVVCDRYYHSSLVYQTAASQEERVFQWVRALNARARVPDLTIVLTVSIEEATRRRKARGEAPQIFDDESVQERVMEGYQRLPELLPDESLYSVDTDRPEQVVAEEILRIVRSAGI